MIHSLKIFIGSGFYSGYFPKIPGTMGSFGALLIFLIPGFEKPIIIIPMIVFSILISVYLGNYFEMKYGKDPAIFTLDEYVGTWIAFLFLPKTMLIITIGFILWRVLDIIKPYPANKLEAIKGGWGIVLDDVISGMYSLIIMHIFNILFY